VESELHCDRVGGLEADAANVARQPIGILRHDLHGVDAVGLVDPHRPRRANAVAMQKHHDLTHHLLLGPGSHNAACADMANAVNFAQTIRLRLDDVEHLLAESTQQLLGVD
jgi:hypothetical protein